MMDALGEWLLGLSDFQSAMLPVCGALFLFGFSWGFAPESIDWVYRNLTRITVLLAGTFAVLMAIAEWTATPVLAVGPVIVLYLAIARFFPGALSHGRRERRGGASARAGFVLLVLLAPCDTAGQEARARLVAQLRGDDAAELVRAADATQRWAPAEIGADVREALIDALERVAREATAMRRRASRPEHPELVPRLAVAVGRLREPSSIPGLVAALGTSPRMLPDLASLGDASVAPIVEAVRSSSFTEVVTHGLIALRFLVDGAGGGTLKGHG